VKSIGAELVQSSKLVIERQRALISATSAASIVWPSSVTSPDAAGT
jgi:hypothetical protein